MIEVMFLLFYKFWIILPNECPGNAKICQIIPANAKRQRQGLVHNNIFRHASDVTS